MKRAIIAKIFAKPKDTERKKRRRRGSSKKSKTSSSVPPYAGKEQKLATDNHIANDSSTDGLSGGTDNLPDDFDLEFIRNDSGGYNIQASESALHCLKITDIQKVQHLDNNGHPMTSVISVSEIKKHTKEIDVECIAPSAVGGPDKISKQFNAPATRLQILSPNPPPLIPFSCLKADPMLVFRPERMVSNDPQPQPQYTHHDILEDFGLQDNEVDLNGKNLNDNFAIQSSREAKFWADLRELDQEIQQNKRLRLSQSTL